MKTLLCLVVALGFLKAAPGYSDTPTDSEKILNSSIVLSTGTLLNEKYGGHCKLPSEDSDIQWMCLGALGPVSTPTIEPMSCGFRVEIICPGETAEISGARVSYFLRVPKGQGNSGVSGTAPLIFFNSIKIVKHED